MEKKTLRSGKTVNESVPVKRSYKKRLQPELQAVSTPNESINTSLAIQLNLSDSILKSDKSEYTIDSYDRVVKKKKKRQIFVSYFYIAFSSSSNYNYYFTALSAFLFIFLTLN